MIIPKVKASGDEIGSRSPTNEKLEVEPNKFLLFLSVFCYHNVMTNNQVKNLRIVQCNLHRRYPAMTVMNQYLTKGKADIALMQEPNVSKRKRTCGLSRLRGTLFSSLGSKRPRSSSVR